MFNENSCFWVFFNLYSLFVFRFREGGGSGVVRGFRVVFLFLRRNFFLLLFYSIFYEVDKVGLGKFIL